MSNERKTAPDAAAPCGRPGHDLEKVNERLRELVASLRTEKERLSGDVRTQRVPTPAPAPADARGGGDAVDLEKRRLAAELALAREAVLHADEERERLRDRLAELERENQRICDDYVAVQERTTDLAQLYVALERIHGGLTRAETLAAVQEVVINIVGSEELAVFERQGDALLLAQSFGVDPEPLRRVPLGRGAVGRAAATGRLYLAEREGAPEPGDEEVTAAIPLLHGQDVAGVIAIYRLLDHKPGVTEADQALFDLLAAHGGVALRLRARAGR